MSGVRLTSYLITAICFLFLSCQKTAKHHTFQNIVVVLADDHALKVTGAYNNDLIRTPNMDRLAGEGLTFTRAYCNAPICSASRASLLTGKYPHATGVNLLFTPFPDEGNTTIGEHLQEQGYQTALFGKTHFNNWMWSSLYKDGLPKHGFDTLVQRGEYQSWLKAQNVPSPPDSLEYYDREAARGIIPEWMNARCLPHPIHDAQSEGTFYANQAVEFIRQNQNNPFFVWLAFKEPHHPYYFPMEYADKYDPATITLPEGSPEDDRWIPEKFRGLTDDEKRGIISAYYTSTEYMDKNLGLVLDALEELELEEETIVLYISDNGYLLYEHKRFEKHTMWEEAIRQPLIIRPGKSFRPGEKEGALVEYIDVMPTLLDLIGVKGIDETQGKSFRDVLQGNASEHKEIAFSEYLEDNLAMVCNKKWKYVFTTGRRDLGIGYQTGYGPSGIVHRLYDLENDPGESKSVAKLPELADTLQLMQEEMLEVFMETHPESDQCPEGLTLEGKLVWFCEPRDVGADQSLRDFPWRVFHDNKNLKQ